MDNLKKIFAYQTWHLMALLVLLFAINWYADYYPASLAGSLWGINSATWFWVAISAPVIHQLYVWLVWRLELYTRTFTKRYGLKRSFSVYAAGFSLLFAGRLITIIILAFSSRNTLSVSPIFTNALAAIISLPVVYLFYSVKKYFTMERAYGIDHFDRDYNEPFVKRGIFKYTSNGMYVFGLMILYLPGLFLTSQAALVAALFNHVYIWVHYFCTERPDMRAIYGRPAADN